MLHGPGNSRRLGGSCADGPTSPTSARASFTSLVAAARWASGTHYGPYESIVGACCRPTASGAPGESDGLREPPYGGSSRLSGVDRSRGGAVSRSVFSRAWP